MAKKLFISCPMNGRTDENIKNSMEKMHKLAEIIFGEELEVIDSFIEENPPVGCKNIPMWYLSKAIEKMVDADYFIGVRYWDAFKGCAAEVDIARNYGIQSTYLDGETVGRIMPDAVEIEKQYWDKMNTPVTCFAD